MKYLFAVIISSIYCQLAFAQKGEVTEIKDPLIDSLIAKRLEVYRSPGETKTRKPIFTGYGYRVQIFYGSDRREVFNQQARFKSNYPKYNTYITYKQPNYYIRVGDFRTKQEAQKLMTELRPTFPTLFVFREKINAPTLENIPDDQK
ncbi:SPOR domain-containing protein [Pedobacter sp. MW01-1-1]|uniref:SPOR domain-containing protein n=1 Tax=Pedobacter sp. MW01-1-1 TaxID=3383027 RepID=UPI003FF06CE8